MIVIIVFSILIALGILIAVVFGVFRWRDKKYDTFINENSVGLSALKRINNKYSFNPYVSYDQSHTYDNEKFYNDISCEDYLIYQLQYIGADVFGQIKKIKANGEMYPKYIDEINGINCLGQFRSPVGKLKTNKLLKKKSV